MTSKAKRIAVTAAAAVVLLGVAGYPLRHPIHALLGFGAQKYTGPIQLGAGEALVVLDVPQMT